MTYLIRMEFTKRPDPTTMGTIIAAATMSPDYINMDVLDERPCNCGFGGVHDPANPRCERNHVGA